MKVIFPLRRWVVRARLYHAISDPTRGPGNSRAPAVSMHMCATSNRRLRRLLLASVFASPATALAQVQVNQVFNEQGPAPASGPFCVSGSGTDLSPDGVN